ncbi:MAG: hypothetical protein QM300_11590 [Pseudomonadota bacterium]|jgi:transcriptional regulator NrdR family protein|nr:hypothetical protein [Pseudomonadota bacterium]
MSGLLKNYTLSLETQKIAKLERLVERIKKKVPPSKKKDVNKSNLTRLALDKLLELQEDDIVKQLDNLV